MAGETGARPPPSPPSRAGGAVPRRAGSPLWAGAAGALGGASPAAAVGPGRAPVDPLLRHARPGSGGGVGHRPRDLGRRLSLIHISEPTRLLSISYAVFCLKKK